NKADLVASEATFPAAAVTCLASALSGAGIANLARAIGDQAAARLGGGVAPTRLRHRRAVEEAAGHLERAIAAPLPELMAEDLRLAARALGRITGRIDVEDILDVVFREFCIGK
ncbi:MAG: tRNA uridine-5-carboxymethylaminomethyl(34) synthesis GTPase MnmE, partial [Alphaproteobacteria bacterium]|nr:tRNA uridine-5-carboxymethylaminomethyl(34) synthesis GTPase MnmE [Alphaproteobacteria bacterium]